MDEARAAPLGEGSDIGRAFYVDGPVLRLGRREVGQRGAVDDEVEPIGKFRVVDAQARNAHVAADPCEGSGDRRSADRPGRLGHRAIGADEAAVPMDEAYDPMPALGEDTAQFGPEEAGRAGDQDAQGCHQQHAVDDGPDASPPKGRSVPQPAKMPKCRVKSPNRSNSGANRVSATIR